jgi:hypothetical protein
MEDDAQGCHEDNQHRIVHQTPGDKNPPKNLVLQNIHGFTLLANGLVNAMNDFPHVISFTATSALVAALVSALWNHLAWIE